MYFPPELYRPIIQYINDPKVLYNLLFVSRIVNDEAEHQLYRSLRIAPGDHIPLLGHLASCPRVANLVHTLWVTGPLGPVPGSFRPALLAALTGLKELKVLTIHGLSTPDGYYVLSNCTVRLRALTFSIAYWDTDYKLLATQTQLEELIVKTSSGLGNVVEVGAFPNLSVLGCPAPDIPRCLATHPNVNRLEWAQGILEPVWPPFENIKSLNMNLYSTDNAVVEKILRLFPSLNYLQCSVWSDISKLSTTGPSPCLLNAIESIGPLHFVNLRKIYLHCKWRSIITSSETFSDGFSPLFNILPTLRAVALHIDAVCFEWTGNTSQYTVVQGDPDDWKHIRWVSP